MSRYVVDASVVAKWFLPEVHTTAAVRLLEGGHDLLVPDLVFPEVGNVLWKKVRLGEIVGNEARRILRTLRSIPLEVHPTMPLLAAAFELAIGLDRTVYDCVYLTLAVQKQCQMVTADSKLRRAIQQSGLETNLLWVQDLQPGRTGHSPG